MPNEKSIHLSTVEGYDNWSQFYDDDDIPLELLERDAVEKELGNVRGLRLLELGCGTGRQTRQLFDKGATITALDQSTGMLKKAREKFQPGEIDFRVHNLDEPFPLADRTYDRLVSFLVLEHISNLPAFFTECRRVCTPEGFVYLTTLHPAMLLKGVQARYTDPQTGTKVYPKGHAHQISDFVNAAIGSGLRLEHLGEYCCTEEHAKTSERSAKYLNWPFLLTLKFLNEPTRQD